VFFGPPRDSFSLESRRIANESLNCPGLRPQQQIESPVLAEQFSGLLWRDLMVSLLLGVTERPNPREIAARAHDAAAAFLQLHPLPNNGPDARPPGESTSSRALRAVASHGVIASSWDEPPSSKRRFSQQSAQR